MKQVEFDFSPRVYDDSALAKLRHLHERSAINKYDAPVLAPLVRCVISGAGVKVEELALIKRLIAKYGDLQRAI